MRPPKKLFQICLRSVLQNLKKTLLITNYDKNKTLADNSPIKPGIICHLENELLVLNVVLNNSFL
jgi:hypothetical protein